MFIISLTLFDKRDSPSKDISLGKVTPPTDVLAPNTHTLPKAPTFLPLCGHE